MRIITADERMSRRRGAHLVVVGPSGVGKTFQARTLHDQATALFVDCEAGTMAIDGMVELPDGPTFQPFGGMLLEGVRTWDHLQAVAVLIGGVDPSKDRGQAYSQDHYDAAFRQYPDAAAAIGHATTIYWDSITATSQACWDWTIKQPRCLSGKGAFDTFAAYRLLADSLIELLRHIQRRQDLNVIFACILEKDLSMQIIGQMAPRELPGIFDIIVSLVPLAWPQGGGCPILGGTPGLPADYPLQRAFVCQHLNPLGLPAKDRSGRLAMFERPHLGDLLAKINA